ncbi:hypothetical protein DFH94DRAFT_679761 [Russula ochroleuca]|uniref:Uncharacterized protein n=1 Tax=Russula ochroleuca TaxID=152965 RepID=A0A9P5N3V8_9AGAM|nr:hypothetical protein DFH94DRAFT_679761 [Russula ochroleuca]
MNAVEETATDPGAGITVRAEEGMTHYFWYDFPPLSSRYSLTIIAPSIRKAGTHDPTERDSERMQSASPWTAYLALIPSSSLRTPPKTSNRAARSTNRHNVNTTLKVRNGAAHGAGYDSEVTSNDRSRAVDSRMYRKSWARTVWGLGWVLSLRAESESGGEEVEVEEIDHNKDDEERGEVAAPTGNIAAVTARDSRALVRFSSPTSYPRSRCVLIDLSNRYIVRPYHRASSLHAYELPTFSALPNATGGFASDQTFLRNILSGGTLSDRLSALTLMVQGVPLHNIRALEALNDLTEKGQGGVSASQDRKEGKGKATVREDGFKAARAIMDWWVGGGAPNRKLRYSRYQKKPFSVSHIVSSFPGLLFGSSPIYARMQSRALMATLLRSSGTRTNLLRLRAPNNEGNRHSGNYDTNHAVNSGVALDGF